MKNILIIGKNSYLAKCFANHLSCCGDSYRYDMISARNGEWQKVDCSMYDSVVIFSGIVHRKEKKTDRELYFSVNSELPLNICKKARDSGVKQLVFLSTMSVYGKLSGIITSNTPENPNSLYGESKLSGETLLKEQQSEDFAVAIIRAPMVYGKNCTGNYARLSALVRKLPAFPQFDNARSMIYQENLCELLRIICESSKGGMFFPQNSEYVSTSDMASCICRQNGKKFKSTRIFNPVLRLLLRFVPIFEKLFGTLCYEKTMSQTELGDYNIVDFEESIRACEQG